MSVCCEFFGGPWDGELREYPEDELVVKIESASIRPNKFAHGGYDAHYVVNGYYRREYGSTRFVWAGHD